MTVADKNAQKKNPQVQLNKPAVLPPLRVRVDQVAIVDRWGSSADRRARCHVRLQEDRERSQASRRARARILYLARRASWPGPAACARLEDRAECATVPWRAANVTTPQGEAHRPDGQVHSVEGRAASHARQLTSHQRVRARNASGRVCALHERGRGCYSRSLRFPWGPLHIKVSAHNEDGVPSRGLILSSRHN